MKKDLLLFTTLFPYDAVTESVFVMSELEELCRCFRRVIIIPEISKGELRDLSSFTNVTVDTSRALSTDHRHPLGKLPSALHPSVLDQLAKSLPHIPANKIPAAWSMAINRHRIGSNLKDIIKRHSIDCDNAVFYTFWFDHITEAIALALPPDHGTLVSGAHGHDIYPTPGVLKIHRYRKLAFERMTKLFAVSKGGQEFLKDEFNGDPTSKVTLRTLGSKKPIRDAISRPGNSEDAVTFFSCSRVDDNKRVTLNLTLLIDLARNMPELRFRWIHAGDGPCMSMLRASIPAQLPSNLTIDLKGMLCNEEIHSIYRKEPIDWAMLMSRCEGLPIALCEALSYGIPVIGCDVPGIKEIVNDRTGILLSENPSSEEFIARIYPYLNGQKDQAPLRKSAFDEWKSKYDASTLRRLFAEYLSELPSKIMTEK